MGDFFTQWVQPIGFIITTGLTLFGTVAKPLQKYSKQLAANQTEQALTNEALKDVNEHLKTLIVENKSEHAEFRSMLVDHERRIYKLED